MNDETADTPVVSVVLPTYNRQDYVGDILSDLAAQTFSDFELLIIDDGSTDGTVDVVNKFLQNFTQKFVLVRAVHSGLPAMLINYMVKTYAQGQYLGFAFDDDRLYPRAIELLVSKLREDYDVAYGQCESTEVAMAGRLYGQPYDYAKLVQKNYIPNICTMIRKPVFLKMGGYAESWGLRRHCDWDLWKRLGADGHKFGFVEQVLGVWRYLPGGMISNGGSR